MQPKLPCKLAGDVPLVLVSQVELSKSLGCAPPAPPELATKQTNGYVLGLDAHFCSQPAKEYPPLQMGSRPEGQHAVSLTLPQLTQFRRPPRT